MSHVAGAVGGVLGCRVTQANKHNLKMTYEEYLSKLKKIQTELESETEDTQIQKIQKYKEYINNKYPEARVRQNNES